MSVGMARVPESAEAWEHCLWACDDFCRHAWVKRKKDRERKREKENGQGQSILSVGSKACKQGAGNHLV